MTAIAVNEGLALTEVRRTITQEQIRRYADAAGDHNPVHIDEAFARESAFGGTIAHGMLVLALVSESLAATFGQTWGEASRLKVRFRAPARPGDTLTAGGSVRAIYEEEGTTFALCDIECRNERGDVLISGEARVPVDRGDGA